MILFLLFNLLFSQVEFDSPISNGSIKDNNLNEISGIEYSSQHNIIWCHNDSGGEAAIYGIDTNGTTICKLILKGIVNRDWEDITYGEINGKYYIFIGEIGDNSNVYDTKFIYYFEEPKEIKNELEIENIYEIEFEYPDGKFDSECLMFDPISKDLILVTKRLTNEKVYSISYPYNTSEVFKLNYELNLPIGNADNLLTWVTAGDISDDGRYILIKNYTNVYLWERGNDVYSNLSFSGIDIKSYQQAGEPQGEAICWDNKNNGFYTVSEERFGIEAELRYFRKLNETKKVKKKSINEIDLTESNLIFMDILGKSYTYDEIIKNNINLFLIYDSNLNETYKFLRHKF